MAVDFVAYHDKTSAEHQALTDKFLPEGFRFVSLSVYGSPANPVYAGALVRRPALVAQIIRHNLDSAQFKAVFDECAGKGFGPAIITATGPASNPLFAAVFEPAPDGIIPRTIINADRATFDVHNGEARKDGDSLRWAAMYGNGPGDRRFAGVWWPNPDKTAWNAVIDLDGQQDQQVFDALFPIGARPTLTTRSADGRYLSLYRDDSIGEVAVFGELTAGEYEAQLKTHQAQGFFPICLQAGGPSLSQARFTVIFAKQEKVIPRQFTATGLAIPELKPLDDLMQLGMQKSGTRGGVLAVARNGELVYARGYTWAEPGYPITQPESLFRVASCSKALTAIVIHQLIDQGKLQADALVQPLLQLKPPPKLSFTKINGAVCVDEIRVKHLLSHTSGLPHTSPTPQSVADAFGHGNSLPPSKREFVSMALCQPLLFRPGGPVPAKTDNYSNMGYLMLGLVIEAVTGLKYEQAVQQLLFSPLGISRAFIGGSALKDRRKDEVLYHTRTLGVGPSELVPPPKPFIADQYGVGGHMLLGDASGTWVISAPDFVRVLTTLTASPATPVFNQKETRQALWDCGVWEAPVPSENAKDHQSGATVTTRAKGGGFSGTGAVVLHRDDGISVAVFLNYDFWPSDPEMSISAPPIDGTWLNFQINERINSITDGPEHALPPFQSWKLETNGFHCELLIDRLDAQGNLEGRILDGNRSDPVRGLWNGLARKLSFTRSIAGQGPASVQVYTGYLLDGEPSFAGSFEAFSGSGGTARTGVFGWLARARRPAPEIHL